MNQDQLVSILRPLVTTLCGALVAKGIISADDAPLYVTLLMTVLPGVIASAMLWWANKSNTPVAKAEKVAMTDGLMVVGTSTEGAAIVNAMSDKAKEQNK